MILMSFSLGMKILILLLVIFLQSATPAASVEGNRRHLIKGNPIMMKRLVAINFTNSSQLTIVHLILYKQISQ